MHLQFEKSWLFVSTKQSKYYDAKHISKIYAIEDKMYLCVKNIKSIRSSKKLDYKYCELYKINMFINKQSYRLKLSINMRKIHNVFHVFLFESCKDLAKKKQTSSIYVNDEKQWKIKQILNSRKYWKKLQYYIKWLNWDNIHNKWLNANNMSHANDLIAEYHEKYFEQMINERIARKRRKTIR
jgi:DNA-dependent RNA polymerase auxiliary subunit epsilon